LTNAKGADRLGETGLRLRFKGGTCLSKGFGLIQRFSEDLDVKIEAPDLPTVTSWTTDGVHAIRERESFFRALEKRIRVRR
jgi:predicted nucleotidyltransferase component of viral defense system